jgi:DNA-binding SARP family transcriptional activator/outer membrane protein assembly factor BamB
MEFRLLGPLEVEDERGAVRIVPGRESALLALLLLHRGEALPVDRIVEELWDRAPETATKSVHVYVSRLRKAVGASRIETTPAGYLLRTVDGELDVDRFDELVLDGRREDALALWRGEPLTDFRYAAFAQGEVRRLQEIRNGLVADRLDERLDAGDVRGVLPELEALVEHEPLWERPRAQLMRALYLEGRQADALELYRSTRTLLDEQLGIEPGPELQQVERAILNQDPELGTPVRPRRPAQRRSALLLVAGGVLLAAAAIAVGVFAAHDRAAPALQAQGNAIVGLDPASGKVVADVSSGTRPSRLAVAGTSVWAVNAGDATVMHFDERRPAAIDTFGTGSVPADVAATGGSLWVGSGGAVTRFDAARHTPVATDRLPRLVGPPSMRPPERRYLVAGGGSVWAIAPSQAVVQIDARTGKVERTTIVHAVSLAYGDGELWALDADGSTVDRLDPRNGALLRSVHVPTFLTLGGLAVAGGAVWVTSPFQGVVWKIEPGPPPSYQEVPIGFGAGSIAAGDGAVWVGDDFDNGIYRIDARTASPRARRIASVPAPQDIAVSENRVWVAAGATVVHHGPLTTRACDPIVYGGPRKPDVILVSDFDLEGPSAPLTVAMRDTVAVVVRAAHYRAGRFRVGLQSCDDASRAAGGLDLGQCTANADSYAYDASVVGVVGLQSQCVSAELPILNSAPGGPVALISPTSANPFLTRGAPAAGGPNLEHLYPSGVRSFARTFPADHIQLAADALLAHRLGIKRIAVIFNKDGLTSQAEEGWFAYAARRLGSPQVVPVLWDGSSPLAPLVRAAHVDGAFLTGEASDPAGGGVPTELRQVLPADRIIVTDWLMPFTGLTPSAAGVYGTLGDVTRVSDLSPAQRRLLAALPAADRIPFAVGPSVDATEAMLLAIAHSNGTRRSVTSKLLAQKKFDSGGDPVTAPVTVLRVDPAANGPVPAAGDRGGTVVGVLEPPPSSIEPAQSLTASR